MGKIIAGIMVFHLFVAIIAFFGIIDSRPIGEAIRIGYEVTGILAICAGIAFVATFIVNKFIED